MTVGVCAMCLLVSMGEVIIGHFTKYRNRPSCLTIFKIIPSHSKTRKRDLISDGVSLSEIRQHSNEFDSIVRVELPEKNKKPRFNPTYVTDRAKSNLILITTHTKKILVVIGPNCAWQAYLGIISETIFQQ
jgi:hypothetical protein